VSVKLKFQVCSDLLILSYVVRLRLASVLSFELIKVRMSSNPPLVRADPEQLAGPVTPWSDVICARSTIRNFDARL
jgi:hypothetical protein